MALDLTNNDRSHDMLVDFQDCLNWTNSSISSLAFHLLVVPCPNVNVSNNNTSFEKSIEAPSTFFVQLARLSFCLSFIIIILALYNSIEVLGRTVFSIASCSLHWVLFFILSFCKSIVLVILVPVLSKMLYGANSSHDMITAQVNINLGGFLLITLLQYATVLTLFCSLEHEFKFRTSEYASVEAPLSKRCGPLKKFKLYITWPRLIFLCVGGVSLLLLVALEITFAYDHYKHKKEISAVCPKYRAQAPAYLIWIWLSSVVLLRVGVVIMGVALLFIRHESLRLTLPAKIYLVLGLVLSLTEDIPNSILTIANTNQYDAHCLSAITSFDICQLLGALSLIAYLLFVRSQYLRVEQESKLTVVWDMQRLLQVNGRKDYRTH